MSTHSFFRLRNRELSAADVPHCARILAEQFPYQKLDPDVVCQSWPKLLTAGALKAAVMEDAQGQIVGLGASVFVSETFVGQISQHPIPFLGRHILCSAFLSSSPICAVDEIGCSNAQSGLHVFILHSGVAEIHNRTEAEAANVKAELLQAFLELHQGYQIKNVMVEVYSSEEQLLYEATYFRLLSDDSSLRNGNALSTQAPSRRPRLMGLRREDVWGIQTHPFLPLFIYHHPHCGFSASEQELLGEALKGHTDEELAVNLNLSLSAVKKRWARLFEKVESTAPDLFAGKTSTSTDRLGRGLQKRHILLRHLRTRPEELTPYNR